MLPLWSRILLAAGGVVLMLAGVLVLVRATPSTANRLGRVAGIVILLGAAAVVAGAIGHL